MCEVIAANNRAVIVIRFKQESRVTGSVWRCMAVYSIER